MQELLTVQGLCKKYPAFSLKDVSFSVEPGEIMGFIGRNGAGKTTTLKSIMNLVHYDAGYIAAFGKEMSKYELENKQRIGFALSELNYYPNRTIKSLVNVTKRFYKDFDEDKFNEVCRLFNLDVNKKLEELSNGMKVKYSVVIALSHHAELLILDEPTSGLDPVSRDEILDIFREIVTAGRARAEELRQLLEGFGIRSRLTTRKGRDLVYVKESEAISDVLSLMGAVHSRLEWENARIYRSLQGQVNRQVNCETANLAKTSQAAQEQIASIHRIEEKAGLSVLPPHLKEMALLRVEYPEASLKELGDLLDPPVGRSGVNHRLRKLKELADSL